MTKMEHFYKDVAGWAAFAELYVKIVADAPADRPSTFVEIGSWLGKSAALMGVEIINSGKPITLHCVDPWYEDGNDEPNPNFVRHYKNLTDHPFNIFKKNVQPVSSVIVTHHMKSADAAPLFDASSVDYIMIDGDHSFAGCDTDIEAWLPKMKPGSVMSGDDYLRPGVIRATEKHFGVGGVRCVIKKQTPDPLKSVAYWWKQL